MRATWMAVLLLGCGAGGVGDDEGGSSPLDLERFGEVPPVTGTWAAALDGLDDQIDAQSFGPAQVGDPATYAGSEATTPSATGEISSVYYETAGLAGAVEKVRDRRPEAVKNDEAGARLASDIARDLTLAFTGDAPDGQRGSARWYARRAVRTLDAFYLLTVWEGLSERSADGYDRAIATLWDDERKPRGIGRRIADADTACGTDYLDAARLLLVGARDPFAQALEEKGLPDPLDRLTIQEGDSPEYDSAIEAVETLVSQGLAMAFLHRLGDGAPLDADAQADLLGAYNALSGRVARRDASADEDVNVRLDTATASGIDTEKVAEIIRENLGVQPCAR